MIIDQIIDQNSIFLRDSFALRYPLISIIILNYNEPKYTYNCINSIFKNTDYKNFEIILLDNGSSEESYKKLLTMLKSFSSLKIIRSKINLGFSAGCNLALRYAKGEYIVLLSNDTLVTKNWLKKLYNRLITEKNVGLVQSKTLMMDFKDKIDGVGYKFNKYGFLHHTGYLERLWTV